MKRLLVFAFAALSFFPSCQGQHKATGQKETPKAFVLPEVPASLNTPEARANYVCEHYWDHFDFADTAYLHTPEVTEQALVDFMDLMGQVPPSLAERSISILYGKAAPHSPMLWHFWETMSRYWNAPHSPMKDETLFLTLCHQIEQHPQLEETLKQRAAYARSLAERNRTGHPATDFTYTLASGQQGRLYQLKADYTLVYFFDPDCYACTEIKSQMKQSALLNAMQQSGRLHVLTLYPEADIDLWRQQLQSLHPQWTNAYDKDGAIQQEQLYDLSSLPSFYLLDHHKHVLLKDAGWFEVAEYLEGISSK